MCCGVTSRNWSPSGAKYGRILALIMLEYTRIKSAFESLHLWLVVCDDECALLLQKKDLRSGDADSFLSDIISKMNTGTDASG